MPTRLLLLSQFLLASFTICAQEIDPVANQTESAPDLQLVTPSYIDSTTSILIVSEEVSQYLILMDSVDKVSQNIEGFRIQLFSNSGPGAREKSYEAQTDFLKLYPRYPSYALWNSPNWVLRVGNYRSRLEAVSFRDEIKDSYPASFVIRDNIASPFKK
ncbi:MAG: SPOR domain-containing protein [Flavobacteriales bacterium]|nr:SPOR domain-containing protein [Flavobacteriales bacterium]